MRSERHYPVKRVWGWLRALNSDVQRGMDIGGLTRYADDANRQTVELAGEELFLPWTPPAEMFVSDDSILIRMDLPGLARPEIDCSLVAGTLTVSGTRKVSRASGRCYLRGPTYGPFRRSISLPRRFAAASQLCTVLENGVLEVVILP
ncbi:Hsp20/alpha crystallin family protein [Tamaricihabitans halophyticus]|uniref:Hsp20/alpha crystallin family protein n=1 Tax=Tamaricihabitans halophyticus TaxID=1262583 RepID=A0A4R2R210_9PSEU|nr:Hsp20/alpha crystallin family protein [Tamaricihabitans halophyticus]TCP56760.1 Hsp20/alpha crystallin family protein [Tamaricihabitans halophyticus]